MYFSRAIILLNMRKMSLCALMFVSTFVFIPSLLTGQGWKMVKKIEKNIIVPVFPDRDYLITEYGAVGNGVDDALPAIRKAIDNCSAEGGGTVLVPSGKFFVKGPVVLKSNVNFHISEGAEMFFSADEKDYLPAVLTRWEGTEVFNYSPLIYAYNVKNIAITGKGILNGQGSKNIATWKPRQKADQQSLRKMGTEVKPLYERVFGDGHLLRPAFIEPVSCSNVLIEDVKIIDATFWVIHPLCCENVTVRGVRVESFNDNNDGCDPESCLNVLIEDCQFQTGDDAIAIKSGRDNDAWRVGQPTENVIIRNCYFNSKINGLCIGSEISGGVRNVYVENVKIKSATDAIFFKSNLDRGGYIRNIHIRNIKAEKVRNSLIKFETDYKHESKYNYPTFFEGFFIQSVEADSVKGISIDIRGFEKLPLQNIEIQDIKVKYTPAPLVVENASQFKLKNVTIDGKTVIFP
jgi:polygalacturonase